MGITFDKPIYGIGGGPVTPMRFEADLYDCEVYGEIPRQLNGCYYKCGPDHNYPTFLDHDIQINGDGMVYMFRFDNGHVDYKCRWVQTDRFKLESEHRERLFGHYRNRYTDKPPAQGVDRNIANTHVVWQGNRLLTLREDSPPVEVDPWTLETIGTWHYDGALEGKTMSAHPKFDPETGEMWTFGYFAKGEPGLDMVLYVIDKAGTLTRQEWFKAPYPGLIHDFAVSREHVIFPIMPLTASDAQIKAGRPFWLQDLSKPTAVGVMPRSGTVKDMRWFTRHGCFGAHIMNAFTEGDKVYADMCISGESTFAFFPNIDGSAQDRSKMIPRLTRMTYDFGSAREEFDATILHPFMTEMPKVDDRYQMARNRYGFMLGADLASRGNGPPSTWSYRIDHDTGEMTGWNPGPGSGASEPFFIPRSESSPEGDGFVITVVTRRLEGRSDLVVIDTENYAEPVATVKLPFILQGAFHGTWVPADKLPPAPEV